MARPSELLVHMPLVRLPFLLLCLLTRLILPTPPLRRGLAQPSPHARTATPSPAPRPTLPSIPSAPLHAPATPDAHPRSAARETPESAPKNRPKPSLASPTLKGRAGERRFPLHPPLRAQAETGDTRQTTNGTAMTVAANTRKRRA